MYHSEVSMLIFLQYIFAEKFCLATNDNTVNSSLFALILSVLSSMYSSDVEEHISSRVHSYVRTYVRTLNNLGRFLENYFK